MAALLSSTDVARLAALIEHARAQRHRYPLLVCGNAAHNQSIALQICAGFYTDALWVGAAPPPAWAHASCTASQATQKLGQEFSLVVFDAVDGLHADALGIATGLVRAGGLLLLLAPALDAWPLFDDPDYRRLMNAHELVLSPRGFLARLCNRFLPPQRIVDGMLQMQATVWPRAPQAAMVEAPYATAAQRDAVEALQRVVTGHRRRPLVLTADRGRGKSAAIGICCAQLLQAGKQSLIVTAPAPAMIATVLKHAQALLPGSVLRAHTLLWQQRSIRFVAPDALLQQAVTADAVFVDEAAAIPVPLLEGLLHRFSRIAFVSTINGYEGNGRGFALRFGAALRDITPQHRTLHLSEPVRWNNGDPLEQWVNALLCLDTAVDVATGDATGAPRSLPDASIHYREVSRDEWLADEARLRQLFALLVLAHYQTAPSDLRWLLDAPAIRLFVAHCNDTLVGAIIAVAEGDIETSVQAPIIGGTRRLHGHLIAQRLAIDSGDAAWLQRRGLRVSRIIVHPAWQRRGIGRGLLQRVLQAATGDVDYLGTSFGANAQLLAFWRALGFVPQRLGYTREQASGEHALIMVRAHTQPAQRMVEAMRRQWSQAFLFALRAQFAALDAELVVALLRCCDCEPVADDAAVVQRFVRGERQLHDSLWALWPRVVQALATSDARLLDLRQRMLVVAAVVQQKPIASVRARAGIASNADTLLALREALRTLTGVDATAD